MAVALIANVLTFSVFSATKDDDVMGAETKVEVTSAYTNSSSSYKTYSGTDLGANYTASATTFKVWAPSATKVQVKLYKTGSDEESGAGVIGTYDMTNDASTGVWSVVQSGDLNGVYYTYLVTVNGKTNETRDVYATAGGVNSKRSMVVDLDSTDPDGWSSDGHVLFDEQTDATVWEMSVRDFSLNSSSGVDSSIRGTYLGAAQRGTTLNGEGTVKTGIDYLVENNINCVQIMPMFDFGSVDETKGGQNWGYDPMNYNVPEGSFSTNPYDGAVRIKELKTMIKALHDAGISVIMDVVYNHTYNTDDSAFENTVPGYYYRMNGTKFLDGSGCGNVTASDKTMFRKYMVDSLKYWANEYHIDGFRFDLMGCHDITTMNTIRSELDTIDKRIITYGEPWMADWSGGNGIANSSAAIKDNASSLNARVGCFDDTSRSALKGDVNDSSKGFIQGSTSNDYGVKAGCMANIGTMWGNTYKAPSQVVHYLSCHDNLTLWDKILKSNSSTDYNGTNATYLAENKLAAAFTFTSQGIAFTQAGEEFARSKNGDHNSYNAGDETNKLDWNRVTKYSNLVSYYKGLRQIRQVYSPFSDGSTTSTAASYFVDTTAGVVAYTMQNKTANASKEWGMTAVILNSTSSTQSVTLKASTTLPSSWATIVNGTSAGLKNLGTVTGSTISVPARSAMVLVDKASFDSANITEPSNTTVTVPVTTTTPSSYTVTWNTSNIKSFNDGVNTVKEDTQTGTVTQSVEPKDGYELVYVNVTTGGKDVTDTAFNPVTNTVSFDRNGDASIIAIATKIPEEHLYGDTNSDGEVNVKDATKIQKYLVNLATLSDVEKKTADVNGDEEIDILDAALIQKHLVNGKEFTVGISFTDERPSYTIPTNSTSQTTPTSATTATVPTSYTTVTTPSVGGGDTVYVDTTAIATTDSVRWAAYFYNSAGGTEWADMTEVSTNVYSVEVPDEYTNIIFCRMKPTDTENVWDNCYNQTDDLTIDGNYYTISGWGDGWGAKLTGAWSTVQ
jgi:type I pullulanase